MIKEDITGDSPTRYHFSSIILAATMIIEPKQSSMKANDIIELSSSFN